MGEAAAWPLSLCVPLSPLAEKSVAVWLALLSPLCFFSSFAPFSSSFASLASSLV